MSSRSHLSELNEKRSMIFTIIIASLIISFSILFLSKLYLDRKYTETKDVQTISINSVNFPTIQLGHYALWGITKSDTTLFLKRFNAIDEQLKNLDGSDLLQLQIEPTVDLESLFVTIENEGDRDEIPNDFIFMESKLTDKKALLTFVLDISDSDNSFILSSPTDGNSTINEQSGVWFKDAKENKNSLTLPKLPSHFRYQARVFNSSNDKPLNVGSFTNTAEADDSRVYSLSFDGYNYPGEDFLRNLPQPLEAPLNLANGEYSINISVEPFKDNTDPTGDDVFLEILTADIASNYKPQESINLNLTYLPIEMNIEIDE